MIWFLSHRADPKARVLADRHYNRQSIGSTSFVPPGRCLVLYTKTNTGEAFWVTSYPFAQYVKHAWAGAWICSAFRNEGAGLSSSLIIEAVSATKHVFGEPPALGMISFVNPDKIKHKRDPGRCFHRAGFVNAGFTKGGLVCLQMLPEKMPEAQKPENYDLRLLEQSSTDTSIHYIKIKQKE